MKYEIKTAAFFARQAIDAGADPMSLVHVIKYPTDVIADFNEVLGISNPLPAGADLSGYTERYYTLTALAATPRS